LSRCCSWWSSGYCEGCANSIFGRTLLAVRDNEERAAAVGYNLRLLKLQAFVISGAVTAWPGRCTR
jgi:ABC-type branched-subunit amino acid transport system permease subunit